MTTETGRIVEADDTAAYRRMLGGVPLSVRLAREKGMQKCRYCGTTSKWEGNQCPSCGAGRG